MKRFVEAGNEAKTISGFVDDIRDATLEYQVSLYGLPMEFQVSLDVTPGVVTPGIVTNVSAQTEQHANCKFGVCQVVAFVVTSSGVFIIIGPRYF